MAGFREFMPGQVWFYYNPSASKDQERKKELGAVTSRPVVIIQQAFYPEWNDNITVCPMTHSDRRSGIPIESTICKDGSLVEGGTVLPYLIYNIKTKFLFPMIATNHRRKLLCLSDEDFEKVRIGVMYHLGFSKEIPDYVKEWKHLSGYDRNIIVHDIKLAVSDMEELALDKSRRDHSSHRSKGPSNPILLQEAPKDSYTVENHLIATLTEYDRETQQIYEEGESFNSARLGEEPPKKDDGFVTQKQIKKDVEVNYNVMQTEQFAKFLTETIGGVYPVAGTSKIYQGSDFLEGVEVKSMPEQLSIADQLKLTTMTITDIVQQSGIQSKSTASRIRKALRDTAYPDVDAQLDAPDPFIYDTLSAKMLNLMRAKKSARRRFKLFKLDKDQMIEMLTATEDRAVEITGMPHSYIKAAQADIQIIYPNLQFTAPLPDDAKTIVQIQNEMDLAVAANKVDTSAMQQVELWETLCPAEIKEIRSCDKRNIASVAKNFGITKDKARQLRGSVLEMVAKMPSKKQAPVDEAQLDDACARILTGKFGDTSRDDYLLFCRFDPQVIAKHFGAMKSATTPSKSEIRSMKMSMRKIIVK
jgi:hypothetical protein